MASKKTKTVSKKALLSLVTILTSLLVGTATFRPHTELVTEVRDGDTFFIENGQPIRVYGLDAPELEHCYGKESKAELVRLVLGKRVELREPLSDRSGRVMALVYVDGILVNEQLIKYGFAGSQGHGESESVRMNAANAYAHENNLGIYSQKCYQITPPNPKCNIKGNITAEKSKIYYTPDCRVYNITIVQKYKGEDWFCTEKEAIKAGFAKPANCK